MPTFLYHLKKEIEIFFTAIMFYTRIPCPRWVTHDATYLNLATRYLPLIGWIAGTVAWLTFALSIQIFTPSISVLLSITTGLLLTGAFHEDGFADVCDGFGGGWTKEKILLIMKDSRLGTFGVMGLACMLLIKFYALLQLTTMGYTRLGLVLILAHAFSRLMSVSLIFTTPYAREDADSKSKPVAQNPSVVNFYLACLWAIIPLAALIYYHVLLTIVVIPSILLTIYLRKFFTKWINGYTGDCLGATQQLNEVLIYLSILALWKFI